MAVSATLPPCCGRVIRVSKLFIAHQALAERSERLARRTNARALRWIFFGVVKDSIVCTIVTHNTSIDSLTRQDDMAGATELFRDLSIKSVTPDMMVYSTLIWRSCARGDLEQGIKLLGAIQDRGTAPDVVLLNSILDQTTVELQAFPRVDMLASAWHGQRTHASAGGLRRGSLR